MQLPRLACWSIGLALCSGCGSDQRIVGDAVSSGGSGDSAAGSPGVGTSGSGATSSIGGFGGLGGTTATGAGSSLAGAGGTAGSGGGGAITGTSLLGATDAGIGFGICASGCALVTDTTIVSVCGQSQVLLLCAIPSPVNLSSIMSTNGCIDPGLAIDAGLGLAYCCPSLIQSQCL
jgi:hypothetical protein